MRSIFACRGWRRAATAGCPNAAPDATLERVEQDFAFEEGSVGGRNETRFRFRVKAAGRTTLQLRYARSWEEGEPPLKTFDLTVNSV